MSLHRLRASEEEEDCAKATCEIAPVPSETWDQRRRNLQHDYHIASEKDLTMLKSRLSVQGILRVTFRTCRNSGRVSITPQKRGRRLQVTIPAVTLMRLFCVNQVIWTITPLKHLRGWTINSCPRCHGAFLLAHYRTWQQHASGLQGERSDVGRPWKIQSTGWKREQVTACLVKKKQQR